MKQQKVKCLLEVHLATLLFGFVGIFVKLTSIYIIGIAVIRAFFAALALVVFILWTKKSIKLKTKRDYFLLIFLGIMQALQWVTVFKSITISSVAVGLLSVYTFPVFITIFEPIFFKEKIKLSHFLTSFLILFGIFLVIPEMNFENNVTQGVLWGVLSAILSAFLFLTTRKYIKTYSSITISFYQFITTTLFLLPFLYFIEFEIPLAKDILIVFLIGVFCTAIPFVLLANSLKTLKAQQISSITSFQVVYGIIFAVFILNEIPSVKTVLGGIIIFSVTMYLTLEARNTSPLQKE